jgi:hypothetical protein
MPALDLFVGAPTPYTPPNGNLDLSPPVPGLNRVLIRQLSCSLRVPPVPGAYTAILDTGAPLTIFPRYLWDHQFHWQLGRDYDELSVAGIGTTLQGQVLGNRFSCRLVRLKVSVELAGRDLRGPRLLLNSLVCQLADTGGPRFVLLGLWGGVFTGRKLVIDPQPNSDDLLARLEF